MTVDATSQQTTWTIGRLLQWTTEYLDRHDVLDARLASEILLAGSAGYNRIDLYARFDEVPDESKLVRFRSWVRRAAAHEPVAYIVEQKEFFSLPMRVTPDVLIPRPESEVLVDCALDYLAKSNVAAPTLLDFGTGSGCLVVAILHQRRDATAVATDVSTAALDVARANAERHNVAERVALAEVNGLALPGELLPEGGFDLVISNPPYVAAADMHALEPCVRDYEPTVALTDGRDGLSFYRMMCEHAPKLLKPDGAVMVEVADGRAAAVRELLEQSKAFVHHETRKDRVVGQDRVLTFARAGGP